MSGEEDEETIPIKVVVVGDVGCGKSTMLLKYTEKDNKEDQNPSAFEILSKDVTIDGYDLQLGLWDSSGKEDYDRIRPLSYPDADLFLLCFSVVQPDSFDNAREKWLKEVQFYGGDGARVVFVGLMSDLREDETVSEELRQQGLEPITYPQAKLLSEDHGAYGYFECSSMSGDGLEECIEGAVSTILNDILSEEDVEVDVGQQDGQEQTTPPRSVADQVFDSDLLSPVSEAPSELEHSPTLRSPPEAKQEVTDDPPKPQGSGKGDADPQKPTSRPTQQQERPTRKQQQGEVITKPPGGCCVVM